MRIVIPLLLYAHLLFPVIALAQEKVKSPLDYSLSQYGLTLGIALLGGLVSWFAKVKKGEIQMFSISSLIGEMATSAFAGLLCFWICDWAGFSPILTAALVGISGHMGTRAITMFEEWAARRFNSVAEKP